MLACGDARRIEIDPIQVSRLSGDRIVTLRKAESVQKSTKSQWSKQTRLSKQALKRKAERLRTIEQLERRDLFAGDLSEATKRALATAYFVNEDAYYAAGAQVQQRLSGTGQSNSATGEGPTDKVANVTEIEPNDLRRQAQILPLGTIAGRTTAVNVSGQMSSIADEDFYAVDMRKGDILDLRLSTPSLGVVGMGLFSSSGEELYFSYGVNNGAADPGQPASRSPLFTDGTNSFSYVIDADDRYFVRVGDIRGSYILNLRAYRPTIEQSTIGTSQTVYLDFNGAVSRYETLGLDALSGFGGPLRVPSLSRYINQLGLQPEDEPALIDDIVRRTQAKFDKLAATANNGWYAQTGVPGQFNVIIKNSKDHGDLWGETNVSRVMVGGTQLELLEDDGNGLLGIAQSVDIGNFDREESALVMLDILIGSANTVAKSGAVTVAQAFAELASVVIAHEAGHFLGGPHQDPNNEIFHIMDQFYDPAVSSGSGVDGIFGTRDDVPLRFGEDAFSPLNPGQSHPLRQNPSTIGNGVNNSDNIVAFGMSTGLVGATVQGIQFNDRNRNGRQDPGDEGLNGWTAYADLNGNAILDGSEPRANSGPDGRYSLATPPGTFNVRTLPAVNWIITTPASGYISVNAAANQVVTGINFGNVLPEPSVTGYKWNDLNADGIRDTNEPGLEGIWIYLDLDGDKRLDLGEPAYKTKPDGSYILSPPRAGSYSIREVLDPGFLQTFPVSGRSQRQL